MFFLKKIIKATIHIMYSNIKLAFSIDDVSNTPDPFPPRPRS